MTNRLPSKTLEGRRIRILHSASTKDGVTGEVATVNEQTGNVAVTLEGDGTTVNVNWGEGDRWMVIPASVPMHA
jgi:hypothetical protein